MTDKIWPYLTLHFVVLIWGASGLVGERMRLSAEGVAFYRMLIAGVVLLGCRVFFQPSLFRRLHTSQIKLLILSGVVLAIHWWSFFESIKSSTVSIGLVCLAATPLFISLINSLILRRLHISELMLGVVCIAALALIFQFESHYTYGLVLGLAAALSGGVYSMLSETLVKGMQATVITFVQCLVGAGSLLLFLAFTDSLQLLIMNDTSDILGILFLGLICTALAMSLYIKCLKKISAFSSVLTLNLEPIYGILLALMLLGDQEYMSSGFYWGAFILFCSIFSDMILKIKGNSNG